jgi:hypothetical protein
MNNRIIISEQSFIIPAAAPLISDPPAATLKENFMERIKEVQEHFGGKYSYHDINGSTLILRIADHAINPSNGPEDSAQIITLSYVINDSTYRNADAIDIIEHIEYEIEELRHSNAAPLISDPPAAI